MKNYNQAPIPFQGQKRRFVQDLKDILVDYPEDAIYIDLFGGSGLVAHTVKQSKPNAKVIYNDFDNYTQRLHEIDKTNKLLVKIRELTYGFPKGQRLHNNIKKNILDLIGQEDGFVDYITLSSSLLFSANYVTNFVDLEKATFYNSVKQKEYDATGYLNDVELVQLDYKVLYDKFKCYSNIIWLVDPPYLSTDSSSYNSNKFWKLKDYLDVLQVIEKQSYIYFTSNKSSIVELCEWISTKVPGANPFAGSYLKTVKVQLNYNSTYTDMMYYKYSSHT